jgi:uncharacterized protein YegL
MITDGAPTDDITAVREKLRLEQEEKKKIKFFAIGVPGYDKDTLKSLTKRCIELENSNFEGIFNWISKSMVQVSVSRVGQNPQLPDLPEGSTVVPSDW